MQCCDYDTIQIKLFTYGVCIDFIKVNISANQTEQQGLEYHPEQTDVIRNMLLKPK